MNGHFDKIEADQPYDPWQHAVADAHSEQFAAATMTVLMSNESPFRTPMFQRMEDKPGTIGIWHRLLRDEDNEIVAIFSLNGWSMKVKGNLPHTTLGLCIGRPSREVVTHTGLDPNAIITAAEGMDGMFRLDFDRMASVGVDP